MAGSRRWLSLLAAVGAVVAIAAVWLAPAALVDVWAARTTGGRLRLERADGTVWQARGVLAAGTAKVPIAWRLDAWPLLRGEIRLHVLPDAPPPTGSPRADLAIVGDRLAIRDAEVTLPAPLLVAASGTAVAWGAGGDVNASATALDWAPPANRGSARFVWRGARLFVPAVGTSVDLGDMALTLTADGDRLTGPISNDGGDLAVRGDITLRANDAIVVALALTPRRVDNAGLTRMLAAFATADASGWRVDWRLPLR